MTLADWPLPTERSIAYQQHVADSVLVRSMSRRRKPRHAISAALVHA